MIRILFVCLGNICRSPMAEAVLRHKVQVAGAEDRISVDSAGTGGWHLGQLPHVGTREVLNDHAISFKGIHARSVKPDDFKKFDCLIAMDRSNEEDLNRMAKRYHLDQRKIIRFMNLLDNRPYKDVPDPYYTGRFDVVYQLVDRGTEVLLSRLLNKSQ